MKSAEEYYRDHSIIFFLLIFLTIMSGAFWIVFSRGEDTIQLGELFLALFSGFVTALAIFLLTDFAAKISDEKRMAVYDKHNRALDETLEISVTTGLRAYPSIQKLGKIPADIFKNYLPEEGVVKVMSSSGHRWMQLEEGQHVSSDLLTLPLLMMRPVTLNLLMHSPLIELIGLLDKLRTIEPGCEKLDPLNIAILATLINGKLIPLSSSTIARGMSDHLKFEDTLNAIMNSKATWVTVGKKEYPLHRDFKIEVRVTPSIFSSDFFTVSDKANDKTAVFAAYPMVTRPHRQGISVSVRDALRTSSTPQNIAKNFTDEFDHFWEGATPFQEYLMNYRDLMNEIVSHKNVSASDL